MASPNYHNRRLEANAKSFTRSGTAKLFALSVAALLGNVAPAVANDDAELGSWLMERGRKVGWIQAICSFHKLGYLRADIAEGVILTMLDGEAKISPNMAKTTKEIVLERYPHCKSIWPRKYLE